VKILVTGGAGFIGSSLVRRIIADGRHDVVNVDLLTYAASPEALASVAKSPRYAFEQADIADADAMRAIFARHRPGAVIALAAESHVDRSIDGPAPFIRTNIVGTFTLLEAATAYWQGLEPGPRAEFRFLHVSTDEVFGSLGAEGRFADDSPYRPNSPYAASKAAADHLVRAWHKTYRLPAIVTNSSNNFGPFQFPEKLIPLTISRALDGLSIPVYGKGENVRDWIYVEDHVDGLLTVLANGSPGANYNIGGNSERANLAVVEEICRLLDELVPTAARGARKNLISFVTDRPGHDFRYAIDSTRIEQELSWRPRHAFEDALAKTVRWYVENESWWRRTRTDSYDGERLGLARAPGRA
jgi:dTDP-glucose 4,6-dehydratase